ncbi:MAG: hypothetical protein K2O42_00125, partial [Oscillospiraceae bacterium]|nr:hypothetical protein [Oscillospiraceae bacterium]
TKEVIITMKRSASNLHKDHRKRMRQRFHETGLNGFHEHEILEMLLFHCIPRKDTNLLAHRLLEKFHTLKNVLESSPEELKLVDGVGDSIAFYLNFLNAVFKFCQRQKLDQIRLETSEKRQNFFLSQLRDESQEELFMIACLDHTMHLQHCSTLGKGNCEKVQIDAKKVAQYVLASDCPNVIIAHNHPRGSACPSAEDINATVTIKNIMKALGVDLLDHIIVGNGEVCSLAENYRF